MSTITIPIAVTLESSSVAVMNFVLSDGHEIKREGTDEEIGTEIARSAWPSLVVSWRRIDLADVPRERIFRDAWADSGSGPLTVDMPAARTIQMARIRAKRDAALITLDDLQTRELGRGRGIEVAAIEAQKQTLRDLPATILPAVDKATTPEDLARIGL